MEYNEITEEMWDKIEADGIAVLQYESGAINFVANYYISNGPFIHNGDEVGNDLSEVISSDEGWTDKWKIVKRPTSMVKPTTDPVVGWLDKYLHVVSKDNTVFSDLKVVDKEYVVLPTDHGDIQGTQAVVDFINNRYDLLQKEAKTNKQKELAEKKAKLLEELANVEKELEGV